MLASTDPADNTATGHFSAGRHLSAWFEDHVTSAYFPTLDADTETDVVVVGAGLAGLSTAYCLASSGRNVIVVEDGYIGSGETGRTTAQIVTALDKRYYYLDAVFGEDTTRLIAQSHQAAIDFIEATVQKEKIDCAFEKVNGYLFLHPSDTIESLEKELNSLKRCGINAELLGHTPGMPAEKQCILFPEQAQFQPMKYLLGLCSAIEKKGGKIFINSHASEIDHTGIVSSRGYRIRANHVVVATNAPVNDKFTMMLKQTAYRSYVIGALIKKDSLPRAMWWDTGDSEGAAGGAYHYVRLHSYDKEHELLLCGGEDHLVGDKNISEEEQYSALERWARERFQIGEVVSKWSGEMLVPMDSVAFLGRNRFDHDNVYILTGDAGIGMTYCTIGALLITDLINDVKNEWEEIYSPKRFTWKTSRPFFEILKNDLVFMLEKWFYTRTEELSAVKNDEAKIVKIDGKKCGAYRDSSGKLFLVSAECTHLKCMVVWNNDEKSWDCPCHGSRFTYAGKVINGPANEDLPSFTNPEEEGSQDN